MSKENSFYENVRNYLQEEIQNSQAEINRYKTLQTILFEEYTKGYMEKHEYLSRKQQAISGQEATMRLAEFSKQFTQSQEISQIAPIHFENQIPSKQTKTLRTSTACRLHWFSTLCKMIS